MSLLGYTINFSISLNIIFTERYKKLNYLKRKKLQLTLIHNESVSIIYKKSLSEMHVAGQRC